MNKEIIIVKYGSSSVTNTAGIDASRLMRYVSDLVSIQKHYGLVVVSSGSVALGKNLWKQSSQSANVVSDRCLAMLGSGRAFSAWQDAFTEHGVLSGQLLITHREVDDPTEGPSLRATVQDNIDHSIVTVANENDALSDIELAKLSYGGDNDGLAAHLAITLGAKALYLMTDQEGVLVGGRVLRKVSSNEKEWSRALLSAGEAGKGGRGGMYSKVSAAQQAAKAGIDAIIANAAQPIQEVLDGLHGTHFVGRAINE